MRWVLLLTVLCVGACGTGRALSDYLKRWDRDTSYGEVTARQQRSDDGVCLWREVTLHRRVGLYIDGLSGDAGTPPPFSETAIHTNKKEPCRFRSLRHDKKVPRQDRGENF